MEGFFKKTSDMETDRNYLLTYGARLLADPKLQTPGNVKVREAIGADMVRIRAHLVAPVATTIQNHLAGQASGEAARP